MLASIVSMIGEEYEIVAQVRDGNAAVAAVLSLRPDILVLDISMPGLNGLEAATRLRNEGAKTKIIFLSMHEDPGLIEAAFSFGGSGYVFKPQMLLDLVPAIAEVLRGGTFLSRNA